MGSIVCPRPEVWVDISRHGGYSLHALEDGVSRVFKGDIMVLLPNKRVRPACVGDDVFYGISASEVGTRGYTRAWFDTYTTAHEEARRERRSAALG